MKNARKIALFLILALMLSMMGVTAFAEDKVSLSIWLTPQWQGVFDSSEDGADYDSFLKYAAKRFTEEVNPNVEIEVQVITGEQRPEKLNTCIQTGTLPNMFFDSSFTMLDYVHQGVIVPIDEIVSEESKVDIAEGIWDNVTIADKIYFYPFTHMPGTLCYNAELFEEAGLTDYIGGKYDIITWSVDDMNYILETLKEKLPDKYPMAMFCGSFAGDTWNLAWLRMYGCEYYDENGLLVVNNEAGVKALTYMVDLYGKDLLAPGVESLTSNDAISLFANEMACISVTNSVLFGNLEADMANGLSPEFDARLANVPGDPTPHTFTYVTGACVFNTGTEEEIELSKQFIKFMCEDPELVVASKNGMPVRKSVEEAVGADVPFLPAQNKNAEYMFSFSGGVSGYTELRYALFPELQAAFTGEKTPQQAMDDFVEAGNAIIERTRAESLAYD